jgi:cell wall-associated NlpC family hydrolase
LSDTVNVGGLYGSSTNNYSNKPDYQKPSTNPSIQDAYNNSGGTMSAGAKRLNDEALAMLGQKTCKVDFTSGGKLACAFVVNSIINKALGKPLRGETDQTDTFGRSTIEMKKDLDNSKVFYFVGTSVGIISPGDIIISPTVGNNAGHVGIYTDTGKIVSNSTSKTAVDDHFTTTSWFNYYNDKKNLITYIYRYKI